MMASRRLGYERVDFYRGDEPSTSGAINEDFNDLTDLAGDYRENERSNSDEVDDNPDQNFTYDDFDTIDWTRDRQQDRIRIRRMKKLESGTLIERLMEAHDALSGWLVVLLVGLSCGLFAGIIDIGADWMFDLKEGICVGEIWLNKESCCWADNSSLTIHDGCLQWKKWSEIFKASSSAGSYASNCFMFTFFGLLFAFLCVTLVHTFAPYACGSGIPEVHEYFLNSFC